MTDNPIPLTLGERCAFGVYAVLLIALSAALGTVAAAVVLWAAALIVSQPFVTLMIGGISGALWAVRTIRKAFEEE